MGDRRVSRADLKKKSEERHIPVANLVVGFVMERFLSLLSGSDYANILWLKTENYFEEHRFPEIYYLRLNLIYCLDDKVVRSGKALPGQKLSEELADAMLSELFAPDNNRDWKERDLKWRYQFAVEGDIVYVDLTAEFEEMRIPLQIVIEALDMSGVHPEKREFVTVYDEKKSVTYKHYPMEGILVEQLLDLLHYLELIPTMKPYYIIYNIISRETIDGRRVKERVQELCQKRGIEVTEKRGQLLSSYENYSYMKKRWDKFAKTQKKPSMPDWKEVSGMVFRFLIPIWESIRKDEVFFGDWMPEIGRYLD